MDASLQGQLLGAINSNGLAILCGAGLSMADPSRVPSAAAVAAECAKKHEGLTGEVLAPECHSDLSKLAKLFWERNQLDKVLIHVLLDRTRFDGPPNAGHEAIADFLSCGAFEVGISTNFDTLIEKAAKQQGENPFDAAIKVSEMAKYTAHKPLAKIHGCFLRDLDETVWCKEQIEQNPGKQLIESWRQWIAVNLRGRDLVFVGFWSDWAYLNAALAECLTGLDPANILVVDPLDADGLRVKAPELWAWASTKRNFRNIQQSGADFLDELRKVFSVKFMEQLLRLSKDVFELSAKKTSNPDKSFSSVTDTNDIYTIRRDSCGAGNGLPPRQKKPDDQWAEVGAMHLLLRDSGAVLRGPFYELGGKKIRVINAIGKVLSKVKDAFANRLPPPACADMVICVGGIEDGLAALSVVRGSPAASIVRPAPSGEWLNEEGARTALSI